MHILWENHHQTRQAEIEAKPEETKEQNLNFLGPGRKREIWLKFKAQSGPHALHCTYAWVMKGYMLASGW